MTPTRLLSPMQLAEKSGWPVARIRRLTAQTKLRHVKIDNRVFCPETAVEDYVRDNMVRPLTQTEREGGVRDTLTARTSF